nr:unnamed protein product [Digitaria exilis]
MDPIARIEVFLLPLSALLWLCSLAISRPIPAPPIHLSEHLDPVHPIHGSAPTDHPRRHSRSAPYPLCSTYPWPCGSHGLEKELLLTFFNPIPPPGPTSPSVVISDASSLPRREQGCNGGAASGSRARRASLIGSTPRLAASSSPLGLPPRPRFASSPPPELDIRHGRQRLELAVEEQAGLLLSPELSLPPVGQGTPVSCSLRVEQGPRVSCSLRLEQPGALASAAAASIRCPLFFPLPLPSSVLGSYDGLLLRLSSSAAATLLCPGTVARVGPAASPVSRVSSSSRSDAAASQMASTISTALAISDRLSSSAAVASSGRVVGSAQVRGPAPRHVVDSARRRGRCNDSAPRSAPRCGRGKRYPVLQSAIAHWVSLSPRIQPAAMSQPAAASASVWRGVSGGEVEAGESETSTRRAEKETRWWAASSSAMAQLLGASSSKKRRVGEEWEEIEAAAAAAKEEDRISELPEDLRLRILALLPLKSAIRTGALSTRWRALWERRWPAPSSIDLLLRPGDDTEEVLRSLERRGLRRIDRFSLTIERSRSSAEPRSGTPSASSTMPPPAASRTSTSILISTLAIPRGCSHLACLFVCHLAGVSFGFSLRSDAFPALEVVHLHHVMVDINDLLWACPRLKTLYLRHCNCEGVRAIDLMPASAHLKSIERVTVLECSGITHIDARRAHGLRSFRFSSAGFPTYDIAATAKLDDLYISLRGQNFNPLRQWIQALPDLANLTVLTVCSIALRLLQPLLVVRQNTVPAAAASGQCGQPNTP